MATSKIGQLVIREWQLAISLRGGAGIYACGEMQDSLGL
jgi:hypothetical protein